MKGLTLHLQAATLGPGVSDHRHRDGSFSWPVHSPSNQMPEIPQAIPGHTGKKTSLGKYA